MSKIMRRRPAGRSGGQLWRRGAGPVRAVVTVALMVVGFVAVSAVPAAAAPVVHSTAFETVTFSNDTVTPSSNFTVTVDITLTSHISDSFLDFTLGGSQWSYVGCSVVSGNASGCDYTTTNSVTFSSGPSDATVEYTFAVNAGASGTIPYTGFLYTDAAGSQSDPFEGELNITESEPTPPGCTITGTAGNDTLTGTNGNDVICGLAGNDTIDGGNGSDTIYAGSGNDTVGGGNGADTLYGGPGDDANYGETLLGSLLYLFDNGNDTIYGGPGNDDLDGQNGNDVLSDTDANDTDTMSGNVGTDNINVQDGAGGDTANGGLGTDTCTIDTGDTTSSC
jgi:Ca2+-binding RTX toxin-like protein